MLPFSWPLWNRSRRKRSVPQSQRWIAVEQMEPRQLLTVFVSTDVPKRIPQMHSVASKITVPASSQEIVDVNVTMDLRDTNGGYKDIVLITPDHRRGHVVLATHNGEESDAFRGTTFNDDATTSITQGTAPFAGVFSPKESLLKLRGMNPSGDWELYLYYRDDEHPGPAILKSWSLDIAVGGTVITDLVDIDPNPRNTPIASAEVNFSSPIDLSTFTFADLSLTRNDVAVPLSDLVTIAQVDQTGTYRIQGLESFNLGKGNYELTVSGAGIRSADGGVVFGPVSTAWKVEGSRILDVVDVSPDLRNTPVDDIVTQFSFPLNLSTFTFSDIELRRNGDLLPLDSSVSVSRIGQSSSYRISGLAAFTALPGSYEFTVNSDNIIDSQNRGAEGSGVSMWSLVGPQVVDVVDVSPDPRNAPVGSVDVRFLFQLNLATFDFHDVTLKRNNVTVPLDSSVTISQIGNTSTYRISGLAPFTGVAGEFSLSVAGNGVKDTGGHIGNGTASDSWTMDTTPPVVLDIVDVTPDPRAGSGKSVEFIDVVFSEALSPFDFDIDKISLTRNGGPNLINIPRYRLSIFNVFGNTYRVGNLSGFTRASGNYEFKVEGGFTDLAGNVAISSASDTWAAEYSPVMALGGTLIYDEDSGPRVIAGTARVTDVDTASFVGGSLTVSIVQNPGPNDRLGINNWPHVFGRVGVTGNRIRFKGQVIGTFSGGIGQPLVVNLNGNATPIAVGALIASITFESPGEYRTVSSRIVQFTLDDGTGSIRIRQKQILIQPVNDAPKLKTEGPVNYSRNSTAVLLAPTGTVEDPDTSVFTNHILRIAVSSGGDGTERLSINSSFSIVGKEVWLGGSVIGNLLNNGAGSNPLVVRFSKLATLDVVQQLLRSVTFRTAGSSSTADRTLSLSLLPGIGSELTTLQVKVI